jgi:hypothetical protein
MSFRVIGPFPACVTCHRPVSESDACGLYRWVHANVAAVDTHRHQVRHAGQVLTKCDAGLAERVQHHPPRIAVNHDVRQDLGLAEQVVAVEVAKHLGDDLRLPVEALRRENLQ